MPWIAERADCIPPHRLEELMAQTAREARARICAKPKRVLLLPPDITRMHSGAGRLTELLYHQFAGEAARNEWKRAEAGRNPECESEEAATGCGFLRDSASLSSTPVRVACKHQDWQAIRDLA